MVHTINRTVLKKGIANAGPDAIYRIIMSSIIMGPGDTNALLPPSAKSEEPVEPLIATVLWVLGIAALLLGIAAAVFITPATVIYGLGIWISCWATSCVLAKVNEAAFYLRRMNERAAEQERRWHQTASQRLAQPLGGGGETGGDSRTGVHPSV